MQFCNYVPLCSNDTSPAISDSLLWTLLVVELYIQGAAIPANYQNECMKNYKTVMCRCHAACEKAATATATEGADVADGTALSCMLHFFPSTFDGNRMYLRGCGIFLACLCAGAAYYRQRLTRFQYCCKP